MNVPKYKIGDRVRIVKNECTQITINPSHTIKWFTDEQFKNLEGKVVTIVSIYKSSYRFVYRCREVTVDVCETTIELAVRPNTKPDWL